MLLVDFLSKVQPFIPYDIRAITLFYFLEWMVATIVSTSQISCDTDIPQR
jgi:hypothetical protein